MKLIDQQVYGTSQSLVFKQITSHDCPSRHIASRWLKLKVFIKRDSYDEQSYGRVKYWNNVEWVTVLEYPIQLLESKSLSWASQVSQNNPEANIPTFMKDADMLREKALEVVA